MKIASSKRAFSLIELLFIIAIISLLAALLFPVFARARENARATVCLSDTKQIGMAFALYQQDYDDVFPMDRFPDEAHPLEGCANSPGVPYPLSGLEETQINWRRVVFPYIKNNQVYACPSNRYANYSPNSTIVPGDQTNHYYPKSEYLPLSYALNGAFFHEAVPPCWYGETLARPRFLAEIENTSTLMLLNESRLPYPDLGSWALSWSGPEPGSGAFQQHNGLCHFLFVDQHVKSIPLARTCTDKLWSDRFPDQSEGCDSLTLSEEYQ